MLLKVIGTMAATSLLLAGCSLLPGAPTTTGEPVPTAESTAPSSEPECPDIEAGDFALAIETTPADPVPIAESVGLGDLLERTCAYGFESEEMDGVAFFIIDPSEDAAAGFVDRSVQTVHDAGFFINHTAAVGQNVTNSGPNDNGDSFLVAYYSAGYADGVLPEYGKKAIGLVDGDSIIIGSIQLAD